MQNCQLLKKVYYPARHHIVVLMRNSRFSDRSLPAAAASVQVQVEPVGRWFEAYVKRRNRSTSASFQELEEEEESSEESEDEEFQLEEDPMLRTLDPKDWKVSGLNQTIGSFSELMQETLIKHLVVNVSLQFGLVDETPSF